MAAASCERCGAPVCFWTGDEWLCDSCSDEVWGDTDELPRGLVDGGVPLDPDDAEDEDEPYFWNRRD